MPSRKGKQESLNGLSGHCDRNRDRDFNHMNRDSHKDLTEDVTLSNTILKKNVWMKTNFKVLCGSHWGNTQELKLNFTHNVFCFA